MSNNFFFDDLRDPYASNWTLARDVADAKKILLVQSFDIMSLDHDIGYQMMCEQCYAEAEKGHILPVEQEGMPDRMLLGDSVEAILRRGCTHHEDGTTLAKWMIENVKEWPHTIFIHSANSYASARMRDIFVAAGHTGVAIVSYPDAKKLFLGQQ